jgi:hypothetical protein
MAAGWIAVTFPAVLSTRVAPFPPPAPLIAGHDRMRRLLLERLPDIVRRDAVNLLLLTATWGVEARPGISSPPGGPDALTAEQILARSVRDQLRIARWVARHPWAATHWIFGLIRREITAKSWWPWR